MRSQAYRKFFWPADPRPADHPGLTELGVQVFAKTWYNKGMANVYIDGVLNATVDEYSPQVAYKQMIYSNQILPSGNHTIKIAESGTKNPASSGTSVDLDAFVITK